MEQKTFSTLHTSNLKIDDLYGLTKTSIEISTALKSSMTPLTKAAFGNLENIFAEFERRMKKTLGSELTPELTAMNKSRNALFAEIKRFTSNAYKSSSATLKPAGKSFKEFLTPYWNTNTEPFNTITSIYEEILDRYHADEALQASATTIGISAQIAELESTNIDYDRVYKERNAEVSAKTGDSASEIKEDVIKSYEQYCITIEQSVNLMPTAEIEKLFAEMDGLRRKYATLKPKSKKEEEED